MRSLNPFILASLLILDPGTAHAQDSTENPFQNFGGTDYFPASSGTFTLTNSELAEPGNNLSGPTLNSGSFSLSTGSTPSSVPEAGFSRGSSVGGGAPSSVPSGFERR